MSYNLASNYLTRVLCRCQFDISDTLDLTIKSPGYVNCRSKVLDAVRVDRSKVSAKERIGSLRENDAEVCSEAANLDFQKLYLEKQKRYFDQLKSEIEERLCSNLTREVPQARKELCREKLVYITQNYQKSIYQSCSSDLLNNQENKNTCVETNVYKYLLSVTQEDYFGVYCGIEESDSEYQQKRLACDRDIKVKLKNTYYKDEIAFCFNESNFMTIQEMAINTCQNFFIDKTIGFMTEEEMQNFVNCLRNASDDDSINQCLAQHYAGIDEYSIILELEDKYCNKDLYPNEQERKQCVMDLLVNNFSNIETYQSCVELVIDIADPQLKNIEFNRCQRREHLRRLLEDDVFEVADCYDRDKFSGEGFIEKQKSCLDTASEFNDYLVQCENKSPSAARECLFNSDPKFGTHVNRYIVTKAKKLGIDYSSCDSKSGVEKTQCIADLVYNNPYGVNPANLDSNICNSADNPAVCTAQHNEADQIIQEVDSMDVDVSLSSSTVADGPNRNLQNPTGDVIGLNETMATTNEFSPSDANGGELSLGAEGPESQQGDNSPIFNLSVPDTDDATALANEIDSIAITSQDPICMCRKRAGTAQITGRAMNMLTINTAQDQAQRAMSNTSNGQTQSFGSMLSFQRAVTGSHHLITATSAIAQNQLLTGIQLESQRMARNSSALPTNCHSDVNAFFDLNEKGEFKKIVINNINNANSISDVERNLLEGIDIMLSQSSSHEYDEKLLLQENVFNDLEEYKFASILVIQFIEQLMIKSAYGAEEDGDENVGGTVMGALSTGNIANFTRAMNELRVIQKMPEIDRSSAYLETVDEQREEAEVLKTKSIAQEGAITEIGNQYNENNN